MTTFLSYFCNSSWNTLFWTQVSSYIDLTGVLHCLYWTLHCFVFFALLSIVCISLHFMPSPLYCSQSYLSACSSTVLEERCFDSLTWPPTWPVVLYPHSSEQSTKSAIHNFKALPASGIDTFSRRRNVLFRTGGTHLDCTLPKREDVLKSGQMKPIYLRGETPLQANGKVCFKFMQMHRAT